MMARSRSGEGWCAWLGRGLSGLACQILDRWQVLMVRIQEVELCCFGKRSGIIRAGHQTDDTFLCCFRLQAVFMTMQGQRELSDQKQQ